MPAAFSPLQPNGATMQNEQIPYFPAHVLPAGSERE